MTKFSTSEGTAVKEVKDAEGNIITPAVQPRSIETEYNFGDTLEESIVLFGEAVVYSSFIAAAKVDAQAVVRRFLKQNVPGDAAVGIAERPYTDDEIKAKLAEWKPGIKSERSSASVADKAEALLGKMSEADKQAFIEKLLAAAGQ